MIELLKKIPEYNELIVNNYELPSRGYFYPSDFKIILTRIDIDDVRNVFTRVSNTTPKMTSYVMMVLINNILIDQIILNKGYSYDMLVSIDILYLFLELIKFSKGSDVDINGVAFKSDNFEYFDFDDWGEYYDAEKRAFIFDGWEMRLPSVGAYQSVIDYAILKGKNADNNIDLTLLYFLKENSYFMGVSEIENLSLCFNDLSAKERERLKKITKKLEGHMTYRINDGEKEIGMTPDMVVSILISG